MRIFVSSGYGWWGNFLPTDLDGDDTQIGGGETAMIQVSRHLAMLGHDVTVFHDIKRPGRYDNVDYLPTAMFIPLAVQMEFDVLVCWDAPSLMNFADRAKVRVVAFQLNDARIGIYDYMADLYFHPSEWHRDRFLRMFPEMTESKCRARMTNGIDPERYRGGESITRNDKRVIYSSSPDRGLHHLLRVWPNVVEQVSDAELHVFYDMDKWFEVDHQMEKEGLPSPTRERAREIERLRADGVPQVTFHGGVGQGRLAKEQLASGVMAYPCDPVQPTEGFSMTCLEAVTAGCQLITTDADALKELWANVQGVTVLPLPVDDNVWIDTLVRTLNADSRPQPLQPDKTLLWSSIAKKWEREFETCLKRYRGPNSGSPGFLESMRSSLSNTS